MTAENIAVGGIAAGGIAAESIAAQHLSLWPRMPAAYRVAWQQRLQTFLREVPFWGAHELEVTETMRLTVGAHMGLAALGLGDDAFHGLHGITLYPDEFQVEEIEEDELTGVISESISMLSGQALGAERIVLSWQDVLQSGASAPDDCRGYNVVIHEFTHFLQASRPHGDPRALELLRTEHARLEHAVRRGRAGLLDPYGAESPEEFLAIAAEAFFEVPTELQQHHASVYDLLSRSFRLDPLAWQP